MPPASTVNRNTLCARRAALSRLAGGSLHVVRRCESEAQAVDVSMIRVAELMRRMPQLAALDARLADPEWHPTEQEKADALHALAKHRAARQSELLTNAPPSIGSHAPVSCRPCGLGAGSTVRDRE